MLTLDELERRAYIENDQATLRGIAAAEAGAYDEFAAQHEAELQELDERIATLEERNATLENAIDQANAAALELVEALKETQ